MSQPVTASNRSVARCRRSKRRSQGALFVACAALAIALSGERVQAQTDTVIVPANVEWFDTGIDVRAGAANLLSITPTGNWTNVPGGQMVDGAGYGSLLPNAIAPTESFASLIGRVNETIFGIGRSFRKGSPASGRLFLSMNDVPGTFGDNVGQLSVVVTRTINKAVTTFTDPVIFLDLLSADPTPFFERPSFRWVLRNRIRPEIKGEFRVLLDGVPASADISPSPIVLGLGPSSDLSGTLLLFTGAFPHLDPGDHTITLELRALTPEHTLMADASSYLTAFVPSPPPAIAIGEFKADPNYQDQGKEVALSWKLQPTSSCVPADLLLKKKDYGEPEVLLLQVPNPTTPGSKSVIVKGTSTPLHYTLSVACKFCTSCQTLAATTVTKTIEVAFSAPPPAPTPVLVINGPFFTPSDVREKQPFSVSWTFENVGGAQLEAFDVELFLDGVKEGSAKTVPKLDSGKSTNMDWEIMKELLSGSHQLELKRVSNGSSLGFRPFSVIP